MPYEKSNNKNIFEYENGEQKPKTKPLLCKCAYSVIK